MHCELLCTVDRYCHSVGYVHVEVAFRYILCIHRADGFQAIQRCRELEAFQGLGRFERYVKLFACFHTAILNVEQCGAGSALFSLHCSVRYCCAVNVTDFNTSEVFTRLVQHSVCY